jgi:hypothetical protein
MRFLISSALATKPKLINHRAGLIPPPLTEASSALPTTVHVSSGDDATTVKKKWGQQCGISCSCVVRFEINLDDRDRVVSAEYTAQRVLMTSVNSRKDKEQHKNSKNSKRVQPFMTNRTGRLQSIPSNCKALHQLSASAVSYFVNRPLWQIMNYHEFQHSRSSKAFRQTVLKAQKLTLNDTQMDSPLTPKAHIDKKTKQQPANHNHCFDLVEDAITALLKGYVPQPRQPDHQVLNCHLPLTQHPTENSRASFDVLDFEGEDHLSHEDDALEITDKESSTSIPWQERTLNSLLFEIPRLLSWRNGNDDEQDEGYMVEYNFSTKEGSQQQFTHSERECVKPAFRWSALDWMDWFENDRVNQQQEIQMREKESSLVNMNRLSGSFSSLSHASDWLTFVDAIQSRDEVQRNGTANGSKSEQSA